MTTSGYRCPSDISKIPWGSMGYAVTQLSKNGSSNQHIAGMLNCDQSPFASVGTRTSTFSPPNRTLQSSHYQRSLTIATPITFSYDWHIILLILGSDVPSDKAAESVVNGLSSCPESKGVWIRPPPPGMTVLIATELQTGFKFDTNSLSLTINLNVAA